MLYIFGVDNKRKKKRDEKKMVIDLPLLSMHGGGSAFTIYLVKCITLSKLYTVFEYPLCDLFRRTNGALSSHANPLCGLFRGTGDGIRTLCDLC